MSVGGTLVVWAGFLVLHELELVDEVQIIGGGGGGVKLEVLGSMVFDILMNVDR